MTLDTYPLKYLPILIQQRPKLPKLRDVFLVVHQKKEKFSLSEMFSCDLKFAIDLLRNGKVKNTLEGSKS